jgi:hypothetical protein
MSVLARSGDVEFALPIQLDATPCVTGGNPACQKPPDKLTIAGTYFNVLSGVSAELQGVPYTAQIVAEDPNDLVPPQTPTYLYSCPGCPDPLSVDTAGVITDSNDANMLYGNKPSYFTVVGTNGNVAIAIPVKLVKADAGLTVSLSSGSASSPNQSGDQNQTNPAGGGKGNQQGPAKGQGPSGGGKQGNNSQTAQTNSVSNNSGSSQGVKCVVSIGSPCTFSRSMRSDDREFFDFSLGVVVPGAKERVYTTPTTSSITTHTDVYAFLDLYPFFISTPKSGLPPHFLVGLPITSSVFHRPLFGASENVSSWTGLERLGFPRISLFGGVVYMQQQVLTASGSLVTDRALKPVYGVELSVSSLISKIGSGGKNASSKGSGSKTSSTSTH